MVHAPGPYVQIAPPMGWDGYWPEHKERDLYGEQGQETSHTVGVGLPRGHAERGEQDHRVVQAGANPDPSRIEVDLLIPLRFEVPRVEKRLALCPKVELIPADDQDDRDE